LHLNKYIGTAHGSCIINVSSLLSEQNIDNILIKKIIDKTGANHIFKCSDNENSLSLSLKAYENLQTLQELNFDNLIYVTETAILHFPGNAFLFASENNIKEKTKLYDINAGCSGFVDAINIGWSLTGNSLIVCSETYSKGIKKFNRSISPIFSDAAAVFFLDKKKFKVHDVLSGYKKNSFNDLCQNKDQDIYMNGLNVFSFTNSKVLINLEKFIKKNSDKNIKKIYIHQGSGIVCDFFKKKLNKYNIDIPSNIKKRGNAVSATIPILIKDDNYNFGKDDYFIICGFGVGLNYSMALVQILDE